MFTGSPSFRMGSQGSGEDGVFSHEERSLFPSRWLRTFVENIAYQLFVAYNVKRIDCLKIFSILHYKRINVNIIYSLLLKPLNI